MKTFKYKIILCILSIIFLSSGVFLYNFKKNGVKINAVVSDIIKRGDKNYHYIEYTFEYDGKHIRETNIEYGKINRTVGKSIPILYDIKNEYISNINKTFTLTLSICFIIIGLIAFFISIFYIKNIR